MHKYCPFREKQNEVRPVWYMISYILCDIAWSSIYLLVLEWGEPLGILSTNQWEKDINSWDPRKWAILGDHWSELSLIFVCPFWWTWTFFNEMANHDAMVFRTPWFLWSHFRLSNEGHVFLHFHNPKSMSMSWCAFSVFSFLSQA